MNFQNQEEAQEFLLFLISHLKITCFYNLRVCFEKGTLESPQQVFLKSIRSYLSSDELMANEGFFIEIYKNAFHTNTIPKKRNHIAVICSKKNPKEPASNKPLRFWIDLDCLAYQLNLHYKTSHVFRINYKVSTMSFGNLECMTAINSNFDVFHPYDVLFYSTLLTGCASYAVFLAVALTLITMSTIGLVSLSIGGGLFAGLAGYGFFKAASACIDAQQKTEVIPLKTVFDPEPVEEIFQKHFTGPKSGVVVPIASQPAC